METSLKLYAYVLECVENKYYVGIAYNLEKRILQHISSGKRSAIFTKIYKPVTKLVNLSNGLLVFLF